MRVLPTACTRNPRDLTTNTLQISTIVENCTRALTPFYTTCKWTSYLLCEAKPWAPVKSLSAMTPQSYTVEIYSRFRVDFFASIMLSNDGSAEHTLGVIHRTVVLFLCSSHPEANTDKTAHITDALWAPLISTRNSRRSIFNTVIKWGYRQINNGIALSVSLTDST